MRAIARLARRARRRTPIVAVSARDEPADDEREIAQRLRRRERRTACGSAPDPSPATSRRESGLELAARDAVDRRPARVIRMRRRRVVADRRLRIPVAAVAVEEARLRREHHRLIVGCRRAALARAARASRDRASAARAGRRRRSSASARVSLQQRRRQVDDERVLVLHADAEQPAVLVADDRLDDQRVGEPQRQRAERGRRAL